jgi:hypothetical protein
MSRRLLVAALVAPLGAALALTGLTTAPARAVTWPEPAVVAGPQPAFSYRYDPQTVVTPDGTTVASWADTGSLDSVMVAEHPAGGSWSTPVPVAPANVWGNRLAVGPDGTLAIVYQNVVAGKVVVGAVVRPAGGSWSSPTTLSDPTKTANSPHVAIGAGTVTAVWVQDSGAASRVLVNSRPVGAAGTWGSAVTFVDAGVSGADVAAGPAGTIVTWLKLSDPADFYAANTLRSSFHGTTGSWSAPVSVSDSTRRVQVAEPAAGADGTLAVAWESRLPTTAGYYTSARTMAAIQPPGGAWGAPALLSDPDIEGRYPHVGVGADGTTTVVWESYDGANTKVATRLHRSGSWQPEEVLTQSVDSESGPQLALGPDGTAVVTFADLENGMGVAIRPPGSAWRPTDFFATPAQTGYYRSVGVGAGTVAFVWISGDDDVLLAVVADHLLPLPPLPPPSSPSAETGKVTGPAKVDKGKKASYSFTGTPGSVTFECRVDTTRHQQTGAKGKQGKKPVPWRTCQSPVKVKTKRLTLGKHTLYVRAVLAGVPDPTPSTKRFKVR